MRCCLLCVRPLPARRRRYCSAECLRVAGLLWKRAQRRNSRGSRYWLDFWVKHAGDEAEARAAYNAYMRQYMRGYRRSRRRPRDSAPPTTEPPRPGE